MTEDEAKTKWCPFARQSVTIDNRGSPLNGFSANRFNDDKASMCIASACMAWSWKLEQTNKPPAGGMSWPQVEPIYRQAEHGSCGLARGGF